MPGQYTFKVPSSSIARIRFYNTTSVNWYSSSTVSSLFVALQTVNFSAVASRANGLACITSLPDVSVASIDYRFPSPGVFVSSVYPPFQRIVSDLLSALSYKEPRTEGALSEFYVTSFNAFHATLLELSNFLRTGTGFQDRTTFEEYYGLIWEETVQVVPSPHGLHPSS
jgi:hypothetical protein